MLSAPPRTQIPALDDLPHVIETPRVKLRPPVDADADTLFPYVSDPELPTHMTWAAHRDLDETREWITKTRESIANGSDMVWIIEHDDAAVGCVGLHAITWARLAVRFDRAVLGYWLGRPHWGKGLMTEAVTAATRWAFETLGLHKVVVSCFEQNIGSRRVIEKVGFRLLCKQEDDVWRDGRWHAHLLYELIASEWADSTRTLRFNRPRPAS